jgi:hypothetical protein
MACTLEFVDDVQSAIDHINRYGRYGACSFKHTFPTYCFYWTKFVCLKYFCFSAHTDCIITTDKKSADTFLQQVDRYLFNFVLQIMVMLALFIVYLWINLNLTIEITFV